jgi:hypothetical protein
MPRILPTSSFELGSDAKKGGITLDPAAGPTFGLVGAKQNGVKREDHLSQGTHVHEHADTKVKANSHQDDEGIGSR